MIGTIPCPGEYRGTVGDFFNRYILPQVSDARYVEKIHRLLVEFVRGPQGLPYIIRRHKDHMRRGFLFKADGTPFLVSDNEAAFWFYARARLGDLDRLPSIHEAITARSFPIGLAPNSERYEEDKTEWSNWKKEKWECAFSDAGWMHGHILAAADSLAPIASDPARALVLRCIRYLHPANHLPVPSFRRFDNQICGQPHDFGKVEALLQLGFEEHVKRYTSIWSEFLELTDGLPPGGTGPETPLSYVAISRTGGTRESLVEALEDQPVHILESQAVRLRDQRHLVEKNHRRPTTNFDLETSLEGIILRVEKPTPRKCAEILARAKNGVIPLVPNFAFGLNKRQVGSGIGSCYFRWKSGMGERFIPYSD